jgi:hypothetical protein
MIATRRAPNAACEPGFRRDRETRHSTPAGGIVMTLDRRDVWPIEAPVGTFDIHPASLTGYPDTTAHLEFICPRGRHCAVLLGPAFVHRPTPRALCIWGWNGDLEHPTLTPSIHCLAEHDGTPAGGCGWHGFIQQGVLR